MIIDYQEIKKSYIVATKPTNLPDGKDRGSALYPPWLRPKDSLRSRISFASFHF